MKRAVALSLLLACCSVLLGDPADPGRSSRKPAALLENLAAMTRDGSSDVMVLAYAKAHRLELPPELRDEDLRWLRDSGVNEMVVRYMTAIDLRASSVAAPEDAADGSSRWAARSGAGYSSSRSDSDRSPDTYADVSTDADYDVSPGYDYDSYPAYGYGSYPYPIYFFVDRDGSFRRFHGRDHRFGGRFDAGRGVNGHRGGVVGDAWRERDFRGRRATAIVVGPRGSRRPGFARGGLRVGPPRGFGGARGGVSGRAGFGRPGFSGAPRSGGFSRSPRAAAGPSGGRARR